MQFLYRILARVRPSFIASFLKTFLSIGRLVVPTRNGKFFVDPISNFGNTIITGADYEPAMIAALESILKDGDVFLDVGANEGYFSILASKLVGPKGRVISVEPQSRLQNILRRNISENSAHNVHVIQKAISDTGGQTTLSLTPDMNTGSSGLFRSTKYMIPTEVVPQSTLSELIDLLGTERIRLAKMDIEGSEYEAILGSPGLFKRDVIENIALEMHPTILKRRGKSPATILVFLENCGYERNTAFDTLVLTKKRSEATARNGLAAPHDL